MTLHVHGIAREVVDEAPHEPQRIVDPPSERLVLEPTGQGRGEAVPSIRGGEAHGPRDRRQTGDDREEPHPDAIGDRRTEGHHHGAERDGQQDPEVRGPLPGPEERRGVESDVAIGQHRSADGDPDGHEADVGRRRCGRRWIPPNDRTSVRPDVRSAGRLFPAP